MMKQMLLFATAAFATAAFTFASPFLKTAYAAPNDAPKATTLAVNGSGKAKAVPDLAAITLGITTRSRDTAVAQTENAKIAANIHAAMKKLGLADREIQTQNYSCYPEYTNNKITGYRVNNSVRVSVSDFSLIGKIIDEAVANGANEVSSLEFFLRDTSKVRAEALEKAVKDAEEQAKTVAAALGKTISGIESVNVSTNNYYPQHRNAGMLKAMAMTEDAAGATPIEGGEINYDAFVNVVYFIK